MSGLQFGVFGIAKCSATTEVAKSADEARGVAKHSATTKSELAELSAGIAAKSACEARPPESSQVVP